MNSVNQKNQYSSLKVPNQPVVVILFNRPYYAAQLRESLIGHEHRDLYLIVDGPRAERSNEIDLINQSISKFENWNGSVFTNISSRNLGCKQRISTGLDWVFQHTDAAIILEDDILPNKDFFEFCDLMLLKFKNSEKVFSITGCKIFPQEFANSAIMFSNYFTCKGWATWKRAWSAYSDNFLQEGNIKFFLRLYKKFGLLRPALYWMLIYYLVLLKRRDSWACCWSITSFLNDKLTLYPSSNMVLIFGFDEDATHTTGRMPDYVPTKYGDNFDYQSIRIDEDVSTNALIDDWIESNIHSKSFSIRIKWIYNQLGELITARIKRLI